MFNCVILIPKDYNIMYMNLKLYLLIALLINVHYSYAQEISTTYPDSTKIDLSKPIIIENELSNYEHINLKFPRLNPLDILQPQFSPFNNFTLMPQQYTRNGILPDIHWNGFASDFLFSKSRTAIASTMPSRRLLLHSAATLGVIETPFFGKASFYSINAGAVYSVSSVLNVGLRGGYNSNFNIIPTYNVGADASLVINRNLMVDGSLSYMQTAANSFGVNQGAIAVDLHGRYRINNDWFLNAYGGAPIKQFNKNLSQPMMPIMHTPYFGGTVEHWFKPTMGVEGGMIWSRDMMSGKMRPRPKLELKFRPGR